MNYPLLMSTLQLETAVRWLQRDAVDDFFPDILQYGDLNGRETTFVARRRHRFLQVDVLPHLVEQVPKRSGLLREAAILHPVHRVLYLATLRHLLGKLDRHLQPEAYSYRLDETGNPDDYPFSQRMERWKSFRNDFRAAALSEESEFVVVTDLAAFYDHISCEQLGHRVLGLLGDARSSEDAAVVELLVTLLKLWCTDGHGIPQNLDPSSFFGSLYLHVIDREMAAQGFRYFRWVDDIRMVTRTRDDAVRALHTLQRCLGKCRLFLATEKTSIIKRGSEKWKQLLDVADDVAIADIEAHLRSSDCAALRSAIPALFGRLEAHAREDGDDRKFRAFANRLLEIGEFDVLGPLIHPRIVDFVVRRLTTHPERTDYWVKMLAATPTQAVVDAVVDHLVTDESLFVWQRFHLWHLALSLPRPLPDVLITKAREVAGTSASELVAAQAIVLLGAVGSNADRENYFNAYYSRQRNALIQRAVLVGIQELPQEQRNKLFEYALAANSEHKELVEYLSALVTPDYGLLKQRNKRACPATPTPVEPVVRRGVGLVAGAKVMFALSTGDIDYE